MSAFDPLSLATTAIVGGVLVLAITLVIARVVATRVTPYAPSPIIVPPEAENETSLLVAQPGGQLLLVNPRAQELFGLGPTIPPITTLARLTRPSDTFLTLFATEGVAQLTIGKKTYEATSVRLPATATSAERMVVMLREARAARLSITTTLGDDAAVQTLNTVSEISRALTTHLDPETTFSAILDNVGRVLAFDSAELTLWDPETQTARPVRHAGDADYASALAQTGTGFYRLDEGLTGWLARNHKTLLINDLERDNAPAQPKVRRADFPFRAYLGAPLLLDKQLLGTLELMSYTPNTYKDSDQLLLNAVAAQAAVAVVNARRFAAQARRAQELTRLTTLMANLGHATNAYAVFEQLSEALAKLLQVRMAGFLLYRDEDQALVGQPPFFGLPDLYVSAYHIDLQPNSLAERLWLNEPHWVSNTVLTDPSVTEMGLHHMAEVAGVTQLAFAPIIFRGKRLGLVQIANPIDGHAITEDEVRTLTEFAHQCAAVVDNTRLLAEARTQTDRAELARQAAHWAATTSADEALRRTLELLARTLRADVALWLTLDETRGDMLPHLPSLMGLTPDQTANLYPRTEDPQFAFAATRTRQVVWVDEAQADRRLPALYRAMCDRLNVVSLMSVPALTGERSLGELVVAAHRPRAFADADRTTLLTVAASLAAALERQRLATSTDQTLLGQVSQLTALTRISRELSATLDLDEILRLAHEEATRVLRADESQFVLLDFRDRQTVTVRRGGTSQALELTSEERQVLANGLAWQTVVQPLPTVDPLHLLLVPLRAGEVVVGLLRLHRYGERPFDDTAVQAAQALAAQAALAVLNAQRYREQVQHVEALRRRADQLGQLSKIARTVRGNRPLAENLEAIAYSIEEASGFNIISISVFDPHARVLRRTAAVGVPLAVWHENRDKPIPWHEISRLMLPQFRISQSYFLPYEKSASLTFPNTLITALNSPRTAGPNAWHPEDMLLVPLMGASNQPVGVLTLDDPRDGLRPERLTIETIEIFAAQAALTIENALLLQSTERRAARLLGLYRIIEKATSLADRQQLSQTVADALVDEFKLDMAVVAMGEATHLRVVGQAGDIAPEINVELLLREQNPLSHAIDQYFPALATNVNASDWALNPMLMALNVSSFLAAPIIYQGQTRGAMFVASRQAASPFVSEDLELFTILANQLGAELESASLEGDLRQQAEQMGALSEVSRAITATLRAGDVVQAALDALPKVVPHDSVTLWLRTGNELRIEAARGFGNDAERLGLTVSIGDSALFGEMARTREAMTVADVHADSRFPGGEFQPTRSWLGAPLISKDQIVGALALDKREPDFYNDRHRQVLTAFANQAAIALENARLFEEGQRRAAELDDRSRRAALLNRFSAQLSGTLQLHRIFAITLEEALNALTASRALMFTFSGAEHAHVARQFPEGADVPLALRAAEPALQRLRQTLAPLAVEDVTADGLLAEVRDAWQKRGVTSVLFVPVIVGGELAAALQLEHATRHRFEAAEVELAQTLTNQAAVAVQNSRLLDEVQNRLTELTLINQISRAISSSINIQQVYQTVCEQVCTVLGVSAVSLALYDQENNTLEFPYILEDGRGLAVPPQPMTTGLNAYIIRTRAPLLINGENAQDQVAALGPLQLTPGTVKSFLGVPLFSGDQVVGVLAAQDPTRTDALNHNHESILTTIAAQVSVAIENARLYQETERRANALAQGTERLTLLNRLSTTLNASLDLTLTLQQAAEIIKQLWDADHTEVMLFDDDRRTAYVEAEYPALGAQNAQLRLTEDQAMRLVLAGDRVVADNCAHDNRFGPSWRDHFETFGMDSTVIAPIGPRSQPSGCLVLSQVREPRPFSEDEAQLLQTIVAQLSVAVANAQFARELEVRVATRTYELQRERERVEILLQITTELSSSLDLDRVLSRALQLVTEAVGASQGSIFTIDLQTDQLIYRAALGSPKVLPPGGEPAPFGKYDGLVGWVIRNRQTAVIADLLQDKRWKHIPGQRVNHRSAIAVPLLTNEEALGAMLLFSPEPNAFDEDQLRLASAAANQVGAASNNSELYRLIRDQAERLGGMLRTQQVEATKNRAILEGIADGVLVTNAQGEVILFNAACERVLGLSRREVLGRPVKHLIGLYGAVGKAWLSAIDHWTHDPSSYQPGEVFSQRIELADATKRIVAISLSPVTTGEEYLGSVSLIRDITREVEVERLKSEFITNVTHELRTPMTAIKGYADVLLMGAAGTLAPMQANFLTIIKNHADRLAMLVSDILDISRIESGQTSLRLQAVPLAEVVEDVFAKIRTRSAEENKPMTLATDWPDDLPALWADREHLFTMLDQLVQNAYTYSHARGTITVRARRDEEMIRIEVSDTGVGIPPEHQPRLFDRFFRGEDPLVLASAGTGLGLAIVQQLAEKHGGRTWLAHSELNRGSTFALLLPLADATDPTTQPSANLTA